VSYSTLRERINGKHRAHAEVAAQRRLLDPEQEQVLKDWAEQKAENGTPMDKRDLRGYASLISGQRAGKCFADRLISRNPTLVTAKPAKLDPKRVKNFNKTVVSEYFSMVQFLYDTWGSIPPEHWYNMDEKGIQLGGGRKNSSRKYLYFRKHRNRYRISSDNLELVTVIECISAAG
ncbi:hypothetical protein FA15DRAFT_563246, partial [Coprinopsis marcescibilis]